VELHGARSALIWTAGYETKCLYDDSYIYMRYLGSTLAKIINSDGVTSCALIRTHGQGTIFWDFEGVILRNSADYLHAFAGYVYQHLVLGSQDYMLFTVRMLPFRGLWRPKYPTSITSTALGCS
jgi:hypothetical protein